MESQETLSSGGGFSAQESQFIHGLIDLKPVGHKEERKVLKGAFDRVVTGKMSEIVFIHGESGIGKSATVSSLQKRVDGSGRSKGKNKRIGYFVTGKFGQLQTKAEPYSAVVEAFSDICDLIEHSRDRKHRAMVKSNLRANLTDDEAAILLKLIPNLEKLMGDYGQAAGVISMDSMGSVHPAFVKFKLLCRNFLSSVATDKFPVVLFLDDLQWADDGSTEVIRLICSDMNSKHCLIIGAYRDDEGYQPPNVETLLPCTDLLVSHLSVRDVNSIIGSVTNMKASRTQTLAEVVYFRTKGNPQFVKLFLETLYIEKLLSYSARKERWVWDVAKVMEETNDASNVLMAAKIERLSTHVQEILKLSSCLGFVFDLDLLQLIVFGEHENITGKTRLPGSNVPQSETSPSQYRDILLKLLANAKKHGVLVNGRRPYSYSFAHDKVFECVYATLPTGMERHQLHIRVGRRLLSEYEDDDYVKFLAVDQINQGASGMKVEEERLELARLNLDAAKIAYEKSAFDRSASYIASGLELFSDNLWAIDYKLALDLHTTGAEAVAVSRSPDHLVDRVVLHSKCLQDKVPALTTMLNYYGWQNKLDETIDAGIGLLKLLGVKMPRHAGKINLAWEFTMAKRAVGKKSDKELLALPLARDKEKIAAMKTLREVANNAFFGNADLWLVASLRSFRISLSAGIDPEVSPFSFASYGAVLRYTKSFDEAFRFLQLSLKLLEIHKGKFIRASVFSVTHGLGLHMRFPLEDMCPTFFDGIKSGLAQGNLGHGLTCANLLIIAKWMIGTPLDELAEIMDRYIHLMQVYNRTGVLVVTVYFQQRVQNLLGRSDDPLVLTGTVMDQDAHVRKLTKSANHVGLWAVCEHVFQLSCLFEDWDKATVYQKRALQCPEGMKSMEIHFYIREYKFFSALYYFVMHRKTGSRKHRRSALHIVKAMKESKAKGCPNYDCYLPILLVEMKASKMARDELNAAYRQAAVMSMYIHLRALAHERAACVILEQFRDGYLARQHLETAKRHYLEWGAVEKVRHIDKKLRAL